MLIEFLETPILIDGKEYVKDLRVNITKDKQLRLKGKYLGTGTEIPIDIVVYSFTTPNFSKVPVITISMDGRNMVMNSNFILTLSYNYVNRKWTVKYKSSTKSIQNEGHSIFKQLIDVMADVLPKSCLPK